MRKHGGKWNLPAREEREGILEQKLRGKTREWIEDIVNEELDAALGTGWRERSTEPQGYPKRQKAANDHYVQWQA